MVVVDDRQADRALLRALLSHQGYQVTEADSGAAALAAMRARRPDLLISDVLLPGMGGYELARRVREDPDLHTVPILLCSAHFVDAEVRDLAGPLGVRALLGKPLDLGEVLASVEAAIGLGAGTAPPVDPALDRAVVTLLTDKLLDRVEAVERLSEERRSLLQALVTSQEAERRRIARGLHDDTIQVLVALSLRLEALKAGMVDPDLRSTCALVTGSLAHAVDGLRAVVFDLVPPQVIDGSLAAALGEAAAQAAEVGGFSVEVHDRAATALAGEAAVVAYRIAQEALHNVVRHAAASQVVVAVVDAPGGVTVSVEDDGVGCADQVAPGRGHLGMVSMRERAEMAGGRWSFTSAPGAGSRVEFWIPAP